MEVLSYLTQLESIGVVGVVGVGTSGVHWSGVHWSWYVLKCSLEPLFYALLSIGVLWSPLQLIFRSHDASELNEVVIFASRICHWSPLEWVSFGGAIFSGVHWSGVHWSCWSCWSSYPKKKCTQHHSKRHIDIKMEKLQLSEIQEKKSAIYKAQIAF